MDFPALLAPPGQVTLWTGSEESCGPELGAFATNPASAVFGALNAFYIPIEVLAPIIAVKMFTFNGATVNGNLDVGIYTKNGTRIINAGTTAQAGTNAIQEFNITDTLLLPGSYYLAIVSSSGTATNILWTLSAASLRGLGLLNEVIGALPLPATATFAALTGGGVPWVGLTGRVVV